ncbi:MAG TPA: pyridoxamine 5'-phosphate oxidase family protein [Desulfosporosinus sp.]|nr:pyridoxamine 5'-phosphate oxidase family protein [Desulfosporosinus sp.]
MIVSKTLFMGTANDNLPRVRPMRPFLDKDQNIWLISYANAEKIKEIQNNKQVELCTVSDKHDVLRIQGSLLMEEELSDAEVALVRKQIFENVPNLGDFFAGADDVNMVVCKLQIKNIIFRPMETAKKNELNFPPVD